MASQKKKKKEKAGNQNVVLVIFLIFFILVSIGLGVWGYYGYAGQEDLRRRSIDSDVKAKVERNASDLWQMLYLDMRTAVDGSGALDANEKTVMDLSRDDFLKPDGTFGKFNQFKEKEAAKKLHDELAALLGTEGKDYKKSLKQELRDAGERADKLDGKLTAAIKATKQYEELSASVLQKNDEFQVAALKRIDAGNTASLKAAKEKAQSFDDLLKANETLKAMAEKKKEEMDLAADDFAREVKSMKKKLAEVTAERNELAAAGGAGGGGGVIQKSTNELFPLVLDITMGKPLWDSPVGKVVRVDADWRQVAINIGFAQGAKPELTFNIFGPGTSGRAEKQMKGSIEIIRVVDANTSFARITSLYDADGREIQLNDLSRNRVVRESEAPIRAGDLLFNMFWGTRVAIAGYVGITGDASENPAEQIRQLKDFMYLLQRNGMEVDAYVDLQDGQVRGNLTAKTRYLILGDDFKAASAAAPAPGKEMDKKDGDGDEVKKKEPDAPKEQPGGDRVKSVQNAIKQVRDDAMTRGMLMISAENFATVIGYRRARSANSDKEYSRFSPGLPDAGVGQAGLVRDIRAPMPEEGKKAPEKKEEEKKDNQAPNRFLGQLNLDYFPPG